jgi:hypothetical protein
MIYGMLILSAVQADDTPGWVNQYGIDCNGYEVNNWCQDGRFVNYQNGMDSKWAMGEEYGFPELNCDACGKGSTCDDGIANGLEGGSNCGYPFPSDKAECIDCNGLDGASPCTAACATPPPPPPNRYQGHWGACRNADYVQGSGRGPLETHGTWDNYLELTVEQCHDLCGNACLAYEFSYHATTVCEIHWEPIVQVADSGQGNCQCFIPIDATPAPTPTPTIRPTFVTPSPDYEPSCPPRRPKIAGVKCQIWGDPHIKTFVGYNNKWDFMQVGEFYTYRSDVLTIQSRLLPSAGRNDASSVLATAIGGQFMCGQRLEFYHAQLEADEVTDNTKEMRVRDVHHRTLVNGAPLNDIADLATIFTEVTSPNYCRFVCSVQDRVLRRGRVFIFSFMEGLSFMMTAIVFDDYVNTDPRPFQVTGMGVHLFVPESIYDEDNDTGFCLGRCPPEDDNCEMYNIDPCSGMSMFTIDPAYEKCDDYVIDPDRPAQIDVLADCDSSLLQQAEQTCGPCLPNNNQAYQGCLYDVCMFQNTAAANESLKMCDAADEAAQDTIDVSIPTPAPTPACVDTPGWTNGNNLDCLNYFYNFCADGAIRPGSEWATGDEWNNPEVHCCACHYTGEHTHDESETEHNVAECPIENGNCVLEDGSFPSSSTIIQLDANENYDEPNAFNDCLSRCRVTQDAVGCEVIYGAPSSNNNNDGPTPAPVAQTGDIRDLGNGCFVHKGPVARGNNNSGAYCWVLSNCVAGEHND